HSSVGRLTGPSRRDDECQRRPVTRSSTRSQRTPHIFRNEANPVKNTLMGNLAAVVALVVLLLSVAAHAEPTPLPLASYDWAVKASPSLATHPPPVEAVRKLMEQLEFNGESNNET